MELHEIAPDNLEALTAMAVKLWPETTPVAEREHFTRILAAEEATCILASKQGQYIAFIYVALRRDPVEGTTTSPVGYVEGIFVEAEHRRGGIGHALMKAGEAWCLDKGCKEMASDTESDNKTSIRFHERYGFRNTGHIVCFTRRIG